jgi:glutamate/tyrosine decarboxylase-like PLP-dependent enzyme
MRALLSDAAERANQYLEAVPGRRASPALEAIENLPRLGGPLPEQGEDPAAVLGLLDRIGSPATVASTGGRFFGFVTGGALPATVAAHWLADVWDQNACLYALSPIGVHLEEIVLGWVLDLLGLPATCAGAFVTGAQMANFTALAAARHAVLEQAGWNVEADGLNGAPPITVLVGGEVHVTVLKALALLGLGRNRVQTVPVDGQGRMRAEALPRVQGPAIVCVQAGNVNTGACDPIAEVCEHARQTSTWVHVDGAFGLWAAVAPERAHLVRGLEAADSWATDAHKWLNVPQDSGVALVREPRHLRASMAITSAYLNAGDRREPMQFGPESSRRARGIEIWAALRSLGRQGLADLIERTCRYAAVFADRLQAAGMCVLNDVVLNQVLVSFGDAATTQRVIAGVQADGTCWCGGTVWQGQTAMRISISSWATTETDVELSLAAILRIADRERARKKD